LIPNITTVAGTKAKESVDKVLDNHPAAKDTINKVIKAIPKVVEAVKEVSLTKNSSTKDKIKAAVESIPKIIESVSEDKKVPTQNVFQTKNKSGEKITTWVQPDPVGKKTDIKKSKKPHNLVAMKHDFPLKRQLAEQKLEFQHETQLV